MFQIGFNSKLRLLGRSQLFSGFDGQLQVQTLLYKEHEKSNKKTHANQNLHKYKVGNQGLSEDLPQSENKHSHFKI